MLARDALKAAVREDFVPALRTAGFKGTYPTWRLARDGDVAVVNIQAGQDNESSDGTFYVNTAVVTPAWWDWLHECAPEFWRSSSTLGREHDWDGLFRSRLRRTPGPSDDAEEWRVDSVAAAQWASRQMTAALQNGGLESMLRLMGPGRILTALQTGEMDDSTPVLVRPGMRDVVLAVLLTDVGGKSLEKVCRRLDEWEGHEFSEMMLDTSRWARRRGASRRH